MRLTESNLIESGGREVINIETKVTLKMGGSLDYDELFLFLPDGMWDCSEVYRDIFDPNSDGKVHIEDFIRYAATKYEDFSLAQMMIDLNIEHTLVFNDSSDKLKLTYIPKLNHCPDWKTYRIDYCIVSNLIPYGDDYLFDKDKCCSLLYYRQRLETQKENKKMMRSDDEVEECDDEVEEWLRGISI